MPRVKHVINERPQSDRDTALRIFRETGSMNAAAKAIKADWRTVERWLMIDMRNARTRQHIERTPELDSIFLSALRSGSSLTAACNLAGYKRLTVWRWRNDDEVFDKDIIDAQEQMADLLEEEADRRAVEGVEEPIMHRGEQVATVKKFSDTLLVFRLKALRPEKYRERTDNRHAGADGGPLTLLNLLKEVSMEAEDAEQLIQVADTLVEEKRAERANGRAGRDLPPSRRNGKMH